MVQAFYISRPLHFIQPVGTSRGILHQKDCWYVRLVDEHGNSGVGEVSYIPGLSLVDATELEIRLDHLCKLINRGEMDPVQRLPALPGIRFAMETALLDLECGGRGLIFPSEFSRGKTGIPINGLIWMGDLPHMQKQIKEKIEKGFRVLKLKVGAMALEEELAVLEGIRSEFGDRDLEIRLDANGAWSTEDAPGKITAFAGYGIHSLEQPIAPGQPEALASLCSKADIPIALDEELIGVSDSEEKRKLLETISPAYIILKPGLLGGFGACSEWIELAGAKDIGWWVTSALESNIGLSAISQWTYQLGVTLPQGLGTGQLYENNIPSPLQTEGDRLWYKEEHSWNLQSLFQD